ncbi:ECF-type sigma factor [Rhodohalobacter sulfatireducens]|uniref:ECF-type sigma factor n=1 Tax=Rhodohalobacter sulfatireducens TaxID=2911366 RepID=A0ABS9KFD3_9BACT|nr:ECF-type sigma factor [Rhodohalobacter sulfatireducens]MCG2589570.1 ECF-type sigma factor [Rhodohalobacter sulfatireducens]
MVQTPEHTITHFLKDFNEGDREAFNMVFECAYKKLHQVAHVNRGRWQGNITLDTAAILHEAYLKLIDQSKTEWKNRDHFFAAVSKAMRQILINYARDQKREKRGGNFKKLPLDYLRLEAIEKQEIDDSIILVALDEAIKRLEQINPRQAQIVECLVFGGLSISETANALEVSTSTINRGWKMARLWLYREVMDDSVS